MATSLLHAGGCGVVVFCDALSCHSSGVNRGGQEVGFCVAKKNTAVVRIKQLAVFRVID